MAVRIRMKKMGRTHRPYYRVCAMDRRSPRDGRVIEELGTYDPMCPETDARVTLKADRIDYWIGVGAQPSDKVATLIKKYGTGGTHLDAQKAAIERLSKRKQYSPAPEPAKPAKQKKEEKPKAEAEPAAEAAPAEEATGEEAPAAEASSEESSS
jgi:small subunit ribosomal protein S16